ncbi:MAG: 2Fe-2S iron-sulfur cluster binding domain-containing protein [Chthoniobacterales bacterium]|nr:2Fe-2S iron-sulfur cluster binding domain-containing protein [Chthoniobacterales bacterium]
MDEDSEPLDSDCSLDGDSPAGLDELLVFGSPSTRRKFLKQVAATSAAVTLGPGLLSFGSAQAATTMAPPAAAGAVKLKINGKDFALQLDPRTTLLDTLREHLQLTGSKKGCDHGQCGACTVLVNGRRINSCLSLAMTHEGDEITTIEGLAQGDELHPMQAAFLEHDGFQCGYCTPGQICSAIGCVSEGKTRSEEEIREFMSGNLCRCGAYPNIVDAIKEAAGKMGAAQRL